MFRAILDKFRCASSNYNEIELPPSFVPKQKCIRPKTGEVYCISKTFSGEQCKCRCMLLVPYCSSHIRTPKTHPKYGYCIKCYEKTSRMVRHDYVFECVDHIHSFTTDQAVV